MDGVAFTQQQREGGPSFNFRVRIGNWSEDIEYTEAKFREYMQLKEKGLRVSDHMRRKFNQHLKPCKLTEVEDDMQVRFDSTIMLYNEDTKGFVSVDVDRQMHHALHRYATTTAPAPGPQSRNCFIIKKFSFILYLITDSFTHSTRIASKEDVFLEKEGEENILHYGQTIQFVLNSDISSTPLYLRSEKATPTSYAEKSKYQEVTVQDKVQYDSVWRVEYIDPKYRLEMEGEPVKANTPVLLRHCATGEYLGANCDFEN